MIRIVHNLARSGGTIMARCLASMDGVALLSEIHPLTRDVFSPTKQAREWYGIDVPDAEDFVESIRAVEMAFRARGQAIVIRGWDHVDFMPCQWNRREPTRRPALFEQLREAFEIKHIAITREPGPMWESLRRFVAPDDLCSHEEFLRGRADYQAMAARVGFVRYEDFCAVPHSTMLRMCRQLGLRYDASFIDKWQAYRNVTGDIANQTERTEIGSNPAIK